jgi:hypothetical protein
MKSSYVGAELASQRTADRLAEGPWRTRSSEWDQRHQPVGHCPCHLSTWR